MTQYFSYANLLSITSVKKKINERWFNRVNFHHELSIYMSTECSYASTFLEETWK